MSLKYFGGGEKWIILLANELTKRGHNVEIFSLPFLLDGKPKINPKDLLNGIPYHEGYHHRIKADVCYVTYHPLSWLNFSISSPKIAGIHSQTYWLPLNEKYGFLPNVAKVIGKFVNKRELKHLDAIHRIIPAYPIDHPHVYDIPIPVDSNTYKPTPKNEEFEAVYFSRKTWSKGFDVLGEIENAMNPEVKIKISGGIKEKDMSHFISSSHVSLFPSRADMCSQGIIESVMCGTPVITTPMPTHKALSLPLFYASTVGEFIELVHYVKHLWEDDREGYLTHTEDGAGIAKVIYDRERIINKMEEMFLEVSKWTQ